MAIKSSSSKGGFKTVTAKTSSGKTITMTVSSGVAAGISKAGLRGGGSSKPSPTPTPTSPTTPTTPTTSTPTKTIVSVSPAVAAAIAKNPSAYPSNYSYQVVNVATGKPTGQTVSATGAESKGLGTFTGAVQDVTGLSASQIASGQAKSTKIIQDNKMISSFSGGFQKPLGISNVGLVAGTSTSPIKMPKIDTSLMSPAERLKYYYEQADIKLKGYLPGGVTPNEIFKRDNNGKSLQEAWLGGQRQQPETYYFGDKEYTLGGEYTTPTMGGKGTSITTYGKVEDIKADYDRGIIQKIEEKIPIASVPITAWKEQVYLTSEKDVQKFNELIGKPTSTKLIDFLREKQLQYKKDLGRFNLLTAQENLNESEQKELNNLYSNLSSSYTNRGTFRDVVLGSAKEAEARGEKIKILGKEFQPTTVTAGLGFGLAAYQVEKEVLPFTLGFAGAASLATKAGAIGRVAKALSFVEKPLRWSIAPLGFGSGLAEGYQQFRETGDIKYSIAYGLGTTGGFFAGLYPKQTLEYAGKPFRAETRRQVLDFVRRASQQPSIYRPGEIRLIRGKKGQVQVMAEEEYTELGGLKIKKKKPMTREQALFDFSTTNKERQISIIKQAFKGRVYLDKTSQAKDVAQAIRFMREAGLSNQEIKAILEKVFPELFKVVTPIVESRGMIKPIQKIKPLVKEVELSKVRLKTRGEVIQEQLTVQRPRIRTPVKYQTKFRVGIISGIVGATKLGDLLSYREKQKQKELELYKTAFAQPQVEQQIPKQEPTTRFFMPSPQVEQQRPETRIAPVIPTPSRPRIPRPEEPIRPIKPVEIPTFQFPGEKKKKVETPYDAEVYVDATRKQKARWVTVANNVPLVTALSKGGRFVDENPSNRFRVTPQKGKVNQIIDTAWNQLSNKFREYTQKSGIKVGLKPRNYLERRSARIDSPGERRAIPQAGRASIAGRFGRL